MKKKLTRIFALTILSTLLLATPIAASADSGTTTKSLVIDIPSAGVKDTPDTKLDWASGAGSGI